MILKQTNPPHISYSYSSRTFMINVILALLILYGMSFFYYGARAVLLGLVSTAAAFITEWTCLLIFGRKPNIHDLSSLVTGLIIPLMLPATIPFHIPVIASVFAIAVVKHPFGGTGNNVFNPAAAGYAFIATCFSHDTLFKYPIPNPSEHLPIFNLENIVLVTSSAFSLGAEGLPRYTPVQMVLGNVPGPMGTTNVLVLGACLLFLLLRRSISIQIPAAFFLTTSIISFFYVRIPAAPILSVFYENVSGLILFGATFLLNDPVTSPKRNSSRIVYAVISGIMVMLFRYVGKVEGNFTFVILLMNAAVWNIDNLTERIIRIRRRRKLENSQGTQI